MILSSLIWSLVYLTAAFILFVGGKVFFHFTHPEFNLQDELVKRDNLALAVVLGGYIIGLTFALGGALSGPSISLRADLTGIFLYGLIAILLLNLSIWLNNRLILTGFSASKEIIQDQNLGVGLIQAANHLAMGLIIFGLLSGEGGSLISMVVFWVLGQMSLILSAKFYGWIMPYGVQDALEKDNVAVGAAFAGMLLALGNIIRVAEQGRFESWGQSLSSYFLMVFFGILMLPLIRWATDKFILLGANLTPELVNQEKPNIGAGVLEGTLYVAISILLGWCQ